MCVACGCETADQDKDLKDQSSDTQDAGTTSAPLDPPQDVDQPG